MGEREEKREEKGRRRVEPESGSRRKRGAISYILIQFFIHVQDNTITRYI